MINDLVELKGAVTLYIGDRVIHIPNLVVQVGKNYIVSTLVNGTTYTGKYIGIGVGTTGAQTTDVDLQTAVGSRATATLSASNNVLTADVIIPAGNPSNSGVTQVTEAGIFTAPTAGILIARTTFAPQYKDVNEDLRIVWAITLG